ncbi:MAG: hypothetical protein U0903_21175 [Planctomycetales bacterium]
MKKLNGQAIKRFFLAHFEKMIFGVCVIIAIWSCTQNRWFGYEQLPSKLTSEVATAEKTLKDSPWPEAERKSITSYRFIEQAEKVAQTSNWEKFAIGDLYWPLYPRKMQAAEPEWMAIEDLKVDAGQALIALKSKEPAADLAAKSPLGGAAAASKTPAKDAKTPAGGKLDEPATPATVSLPGIGEATKGAAPAGPGGAPPGFGGNSMGAGFGAGAGSFRLSRGSDRDDRASNGLGGTPAATPSISIQGSDGRGYRFAAVRGVFPLHQQLLSFVRAHLADTELGATLTNPPLFNPFEFQVERQEAVPGDDPWSGKWERLDLDNSIKLLKDEVSGLEPEAIDQKYIDYTIAMPVPSRVFGTWSKDLLGHPKIDQLTEEQVEKQRKEAEELMKKEENLKKEEVVTSRRKGFSSVAHNPAVLDQINRVQNAADNGVTAAPAEEDEMDEREERRSMRAARRPNAAPAGNAFSRAPGTNPAAPGGARAPGQLNVYLGPKVLLFRYFDFDVEPGRTYRYRVRLVVANPSYGKNVSEVTEPFVAEGETRETPWSAETEPVKIPDDYQLYLLLVSDKGPGNQRVAFKIYEWEPSIGTRVLGEIRKVEFGQVVGGLAKTPVLRLTKQTLQDEQVELRTRDVLLDVRESPTIVPSEHPELQFADVKNAARPIKISVPSSAVLGNQFGEMEIKDQESGKEGLQTAEAEASMVNKFFEYLKVNKDKIKAGGGDDETNPYGKKGGLGKGRHDK